MNIHTKEVWRRERNSGRYGYNRVYVTSVKIQRDGMGTRIVFDAYAVHNVPGESDIQRCRPGSRATWFGPSEWEEIIKAVDAELERETGESDA